MPYIGHILPHFLYLTLGMVPAHGSCTNWQRIVFWIDWALFEVASTFRLWATSHGLPTVTKPVIVPRYHLPSAHTLLLCQLSASVSYWLNALYRSGRKCLFANHTPQLIVWPVLMNYEVTRTKSRDRASDENEPHKFEISFKREADMQVFPTVEVKCS